MSDWIEQIRKQVEKGREEQRIMNEAKERGEEYGTRPYRGLHKCIPYYENGKRKYRYKPEWATAQRKAYYEKNKAKINEQNRIKYRRRTKIENLNDKVVEFKYHHTEEE